MGFRRRLDRLRYLGISERLRCSIISWLVVYSACYVEGKGWRDSYHCSQEEVVWQKLHVCDLGVLPQAM